ncbi:hypothetical protein [Mycoavidus sp. SF9855]|uniref:hypothetical protein n=1 Tax=Mycoavidus sp. SF9855 TaxID=2968475 RepID=UPI00211C812E|nr:hypothetical protein [Mycoavidus sp. SF9855]UUM20954.1 hypothetical protein NQD60_05580 [Mycoavidus sp. SF9855]
MLGNIDLALLLERTNIAFNKEEASQSACWPQDMQKEQKAEVSTRGETLISSGSYSSSRGLKSFINQ